MIYDIIKELREDAGYSQATLAKKLDVTRSAVNAWEMGISSPSTAYLVELAQMFKVSTDYLLGLASNKTVDISGLNETEIKIIYDLIKYFKESKKENSSL